MDENIEPPGTGVMAALVLLHCFASLPSPNCIFQTSAGAQPSQAKVESQQIASGL